MQILRDLGVLNESSAEAEALTRSQDQVAAAQAGMDAAADDSAELQAAGEAVADTSGLLAGPDDYAQTNWEARAIFNRSSSSNHAELVGLGDGSQAEWEARAWWGPPSRRVSRDLPSIRGSLKLSSRRASGDAQGSAANRHQTVPGLSEPQIEPQADMQQAGAGAGIPDQTTGSGDQLGLLQRVTKQAAATAALQKALSNIQDIATGSQQARAAAAAVAGAAAKAEPDSLSQGVHPHTELSRWNSQAAADTDAGQDIAMMVLQDARVLMSMAGPDDSSYEQTGIAVSSAPASAASQLDVQPAAAECSLAEESSSNGSHFSFDADCSVDQTFDMASSTMHAAAQGFTAQMDEQDSISETDAEQVGSASLWSALPIPHLGRGQFIIDPPAALTAALSEGLAESGSATQANLVLMPQPQADLPNQPSLSGPMPVGSAAVACSEQLERGMSSSLQVPLPLRHSLGTATPAATADSTALLSAQSTSHQSTAGWQAPDATVQDSQQQSMSGMPLETAAWSEERSSPTAALQPSQGPSLSTTPSEVMSLGNWSPPRVASQPVLLSPDGGHALQMAESFMAPSSFETWALDRAELVAYDTDAAGRNQQMDDGKPNVSNNLGSDSGTTHASDTMTLTIQAAAC